MRSSPSARNSARARAQTARAHLHPHIPHTIASIRIIHHISLHMHKSIAKSAVCLNRARSICGQLHARAYRILHIATATLANYPNYKLPPSSRKPRLTQSSVISPSIRSHIHPSIRTAQLIHPTNLSRQSISTATNHPLYPLYHYLGDNCPAPLSRSRSIHPYILSVTETVIDARTVTVSSIRVRNYPSIDCLSDPSFSVSY